MHTSKHTCTLLTNCWLSLDTFVLAEEPLCTCVWPSSFALVVTGTDSIECPLGTCTIIVYAHVHLPTAG